MLLFDLYLYKCYILRDRHFLFYSHSLEYFLVIISVVINVKLTFDTFDDIDNIFNAYFLTFPYLLYTFRGEKV